MSGLALALVLSAAGVHATWNLLLRDSRDRVAVMTVGNLAGGLALLPWLILYPPWREAPLFVASGFAQAAYALGLSAAYGRGRLSIAYPVARGTAPLVVTLAAAVVLSETPGATALAGAACLAAGLGSLGVVGHRSGAGQAVGFGVLTGLFIATYSVIDAAAVRHVDPAGYLSAEMLVTAVVLGVRVRGDLARLRRSLPSGLAVGAGVTGAYLLVLFAFQRAPAGRVATLRELSVLIGILASRERPGRVVWLGAVLVVAGAVLAGV